MKIINLEPNTPEWLEWRMGGIGASEIAVVFGVSPYCSPDLLYRRKRKEAPEQQANMVTERGHEWEPYARSFAEDMLKDFFQPIIVEHSKYPFIRASLDGINPDGSILLEVKSPGPSKSHNEAMQGRVPYHYWLQIQQQLLCCPSAVKAIYCSYDGQNPPVLLEVYPCQKTHQEIIDKSIEFWECVKTGVPPAGIPWFEAAQRYAYAKFIANDAKAMLEESKVALVQLLTERNKTKEVGGGVTCSFVSGSDKYDLQAYIAAKLGFEFEVADDFLRQIAVKLNIDLTSIPEEYLFRTADQHRFTVSRGFDRSTVEQMFEPEPKPAIVTTGHETLAESNAAVEYAQVQQQELGQFAW